MSDKSAALEPLDATEEEAKRRACLRVLIVLSNPLMLMSQADRKEALEAAQKHNLTAEDLLYYALKRARKT